MTQTAEPTRRTATPKLGVAAGQRVEVAGDLGPDLRRALREALGRGFVRSGELDGAIVVVESLEEAERTMAAYRPRLREAGYLWLLTPKRGHERHLNQMQLVVPARGLGLIDNKTCSIDDERSAIRFVIPRALRGRDDGRDDLGGGPPAG